MSPTVVVFILFFVFSIVHGAVYNTETFYLNARGSRIISTRPDNRYFVLNVGKPNVTVQILKGNVFAWTGAVAGRHLKHGESHLFRLEKEDIAPFMGVFIENKDTINGYAHAFAMSAGFPEYDEPNTSTFVIDPEKLIRTLAIAGAAHIPYIGSPLSSAMGFFWPEKKDNIWEAVKDQVNDLIDNRIRETINDILTGALDQAKSRVQMILEEIDNPDLTETVGTHFVNIAEDLVGIEQRFQFKGPNSLNDNFILLPLYVSTVNLKMFLYHYGIQNWQEIGLNKELVGRLTYYMFKTVHNSGIGAVDYIHKTCNDKLERVYKDAYPETLYDKFASIREYCALHGYEHLSIWKSIAANPDITSKPEVPVVVYSTQFGRNTAEQSAEMIEPINPALTPSIIDGELNIPTSVIVFLSSNNRIEGLSVTAMNGDTFDLGRTNGGDKVTIDFQGEKLTALVARGDGQIHGLQFIFEDGRVVDVGTLTGSSRKFALDNHHIVGFYGTGSLIRIHYGVLANIAVSFQLINK